MLELRLMHHYTTTTCRTFTSGSPGTEDIWKVVVPRLAFSGSQHLADAVLAISALHLRSLTPQDKDMVRASHAYMAASIAEYNATLDQGINQANAEALFLTSTLIAFQATATRTFIKDEPAITGSEEENGVVGAPGGYAVPFSWFHAFQGVKAITAASWEYLRQSLVVTHIINSQVALQLDFKSSRDGFFGHLLDGLEEELVAMDMAAPPPPASPPASPHSNEAADMPSPDLADLSSMMDVQYDDETCLAAQSAHSAQSQGRPTSRGDASGRQDSNRVNDTRQAYQHAVAALNWAHKIPHKGAGLSFPATVSRRFVELLQERRPRSLAILACFFAQLKTLESVWWLHGMARREVLGVAALFNGDYFGPDAYRRWWPHIEWAVRIAMWEGDAIPPEVWGADWAAEELALAESRGSPVDFVSQIEILTQMTGPAHSLAVVPPES